MVCKSPNVICVKFYVFKILNFCISRTPRPLVFRFEFWRLKKVLKEGLKSILLGKGMEKVEDL